MNKAIGFIGCGNMAKAMIGGIVKSKLVSPNMINASNLSQSALDAVKSEFKINTTTNSREVVKNSDIVIVAVKPNVYDAVLESVKDLIDNRKIIVTIAAGKTIASVENVIGMDTFEIIKYIISVKNIDIDGKSHKLYLGGWFENNKDKLKTDISVVTEFIDEAIQIGKYCNQRAIYDISKREVIYV